MSHHSQLGHKDNYFVQMIIKEWRELSVLYCTRLKAFLEQSIERIIRIQFDYKMHVKTNQSLSQITFDEIVYVVEHFTPPRILEHKKAFFQCTNMPFQILFPISLITEI